MGTYPVTVGEISPTLDTLGGTPAVVFGTTYAAGAATSFLRTDDTLKFPADLMSTANSTTLALTDDGVNQSLTGNLGVLKILASASNKVQLDFWMSAGGNAPTAGVVLGFVAQSSVVGTSLGIGVDSAISIGDNSTYTSATFRGMRSDVRTSLTNTPTYTTCNAYGLEALLTTQVFTSGTNSFTERAVLNLSSLGVITQSGTGAITVTDYYGIKMGGWTTLGNSGTNANARSALFTFPTTGSTIRRGVHLSTVVGNLGTEAATTEGFYCDPLTRGTTNRYSYRAIGSTTGTPTNVYGFYSDLHGVGTNRWGVWTSNKHHCDISDFVANASGFGFSNRDSQSSSVGGGGTARYWRSYIDASATGVAGDCTFSIDSTGVLSISRAGASTGTVQHVLKDVGTAAVLT